MKSKVGAIVATLLLSFASGRAQAGEQKELQDAWFGCITLFAETVAATTEEPAELIANAALAACQDEETGLSRFYMKQGGAVAEFALDNLLPAQKEDYRQKVIAKVLAIKAAKRLRQ